MPVFYARQRIDIGFPLRAGKTLLVLLFMPDLIVNVVEADNQTASFRFFDHGRLEPHIRRLFVNYQPICHGKNAAALNLGKYVLLG